MNNTQTITREVMREMNRAARDFVPSDDDIKSIARHSGLSKGTVARFFGEKANPRNLVPYTLIPDTVAGEARDKLGKEYAVRLMVGELLTTGISQVSKFGGPGDELKSAYSKVEGIGDAAMIALDLREGDTSKSYYFMGAAYERAEYTVNEYGETVLMTYFYNAPKDRHYDEWYELYLGSSEEELEAIDYGFVITDDYDL